MNTPDGPAASDEFPLLRDVLSMYYSETVGDGRMYADDVETFTIVSVTHPEGEIAPLCAEVRELLTRNDDALRQFFAENQKSGLENDPRTWLLSMQGQLCG